MLGGILGFVVVTLYLPVLSLVDARLRHVAGNGNYAPTRSIRTGAWERTRKGRPLRIISSPNSEVDLRQL